MRRHVEWEAENTYAADALATLDVAGTAEIPRSASGGRPRRGDRRGRGRGLASRQGDRKECERQDEVERGNGTGEHL